MLILLPPLDIQKWLEEGNGERNLPQNFDEFKTAMRKHEIDLADWNKRRVKLYQSDNPPAWQYERAKVTMDVDVQTEYQKSAKKTLIQEQLQLI
jgi:hypothetical protein